LEAEALGLENGKVQFKTAEGREIPVALDQLIPADQKILIDTFPEQAAEVPGFKSPAKLPHPQGEITEPISSDDTSSYLLYLPTTLAADTKAPVVFYGGSSPVNKRKIERMIKAAELTGTILAGSLENRNGVLNSDAYKNTLASWNHMKDSLPMNPDRMNFIGGSGGGARTFIMADSFKEHCVGAAPFVGYVPGKLRWDKQTFFFIMGGAKDYNRYSSAIAVDQVGAKRGIYRPYPGGHSDPPNEVFTEALLWLYTCDLYLNQKDATSERERFEARFLNYLKDDLNDQPQIAYFWTDHLLNTCELKGTAADGFRSLHTDLGKISKNTRYVEGRLALQKLADKEYTSIGGGSKKKHTTDGITRAANRLAENFSDVPEIAEIAKQMGEATD
jgi:hypothetical protein